MPRQKRDQTDPDGTAEALAITRLEGRRWWKKAVAWLLWSTLGPEAAAIDPAIYDGDQLGISLLPLPVT